MVVWTLVCERKRKGRGTGGVIREVIEDAMIELGHVKAWSEETLFFKILYLALLALMM